ncbi:MAG: ABC transporter permease [Opitutaceae bacterium]|nr:ABC transporter permease [Opitutaceae bacterium]
MKYFLLVASSLRRKKLRTALTMLSVAVAFLLFGVLAILKQSLTAGIDVADASRIIVRHRVSIIQTLPAAYEARMERLSGVADAMHLTWFNGIYQDPKNFFGNFPVKPEEFFSMYPEYVMPEEEKAAWQRTRNGAVVGRQLADRFGWKVGDRIPLVSPIWPNKSGGAWEFEVVGILDGAKKSTDLSGFYFRYDYFDEGRTYGEGQVGWYSVRIKDPREAAAVARAIDEEFANSYAETKAEPEGAFIQGWAQQIGDIGAIVTAIVGAVFFTILLVAGNTMAQAVRERTEEIGVLKAMGYSNGLVLGVVLAESFLIAGLAGGAGLGFAWVMTLGGSPVPAMLPVFYLPGRELVVGAGLVFVLGFLAGILPALQAMRLQIAVALRRQA